MSSARLKRRLKNSRSWENREAAARELGRRSKASRQHEDNFGAMDALAATVQRDTDARVRAAAASAIAVAASGGRVVDASTLKSIATAVENETDSLVRVAAAEAVALAGDDTTLEKLAPVASADPEALVRAQSCDWLRSAGLVEELIGLLDDPDPSVQRSAVSALRDMGDAEKNTAVPALTRMAKCDDASLRLPALQELERFSPPEVAALIVEATNDRDRRVEECAVSALKRRPDFVQADLAAARRSANATVRKMAAERPTRAPKTLERMCKDIDPDVRLAALTTLLQLEERSTRAQKAVEIACNDFKPDVRLAALTTLLKLGELVAKFPNLDSAARSDAARIGPLEVVALAVLDHDDNVHQAGRQALSDRGLAAALPALDELRRAGHIDWRRDAALDSLRSQAAAMIEKHRSSVRKAEAYYEEVLYNSSAAVADHARDEREEAQSDVSTWAHWKDVLRVVEGSFTGKNSD